jgi:hypothetical protein
MAPSSKDVSRFVFLKVSHGDVPDPRFAAYRCRLMTEYFYGGYFFLGLLALVKSVRIQLLKALV